MTLYLSDQSSRLYLSFSQALLYVPRVKPTSDVELSPLLLHKSGTIYMYPLLSESHHHLTPSNVTSKLITLPGHNTHHIATLRTPDFLFNFDALPNFYITLLGKFRFFSREWVKMAK